MRKSTLCCSIDTADLAACKELARRRGISAKCGFHYQDLIRLALKEHLKRAAKAGEIVLKEE